MKTKIIITENQKKLKVQLLKNQRILAVQQLKELMANYTPVEKVARGW
jgi:hypothetical protein